MLLLLMLKLIRRIMAAAQWKAECGSVWSWSDRC